MPAQPPAAAAAAGRSPLLPRDAPRRAVRLADSAGNRLRIGVKLRLRDGGGVKPRLTLPWALALERVRSLLPARSS